MGAVKLMDFGLARSMFGDPPELERKAGARFATGEYAAPELFEANSVVE